MAIGKESSNLDALRTIAVLAVLVDHLIDSSPWVSEPVRRAGNGLGTCGVLMFFVHTSLVLMMSLDRLERDRKGSIPLRFYVRRIFRLYPLSTLVILGAVALHIPRYFDGAYQPVSSFRLWSNLLLIQNITGAESIQAQFWSLPFEVQMYALLPFVYWAAKKLRNPLLIVSLGFVVSYINHRLARGLRYPDLFGFAPYFFMGVAAYFGYRRRPATLPSWILFAILSLILTSHAWMSTRPIRLRNDYVSWAGLFLLALSLPRIREITTPWLRHSCKLVARYSYGIYVTHVGISWFAYIRLASSPALLRTAVFTTLLVVIPVALYHLVEEPFIRMGAGLSNRLASRGAGPTAIPETAATANSR